MATSRTARLALGVLALLPAPALAAPGELEINVEGLRNQRGVLQICITQQASAFPGCANDPHARRLTIPAAQARGIRLTRMAQGDWGIAVIHDENRDGQLSTFAGIPREGYGFSNNPGFRFGVPSFGSVTFPLGPNGAVQTIRLRYLL